jgi:hypothetical protein
LIFDNVHVKLNVVWKLTSMKGLTCKQILKIQVCMGYIHGSQPHEWG